MALTDDVHMAAHAARWSLAAPRPAIGDPVAERTAGMIWAVLAAVRMPVFLWNVFPSHPHEPDNPFTNRVHTARERELGEDVLAMLVDLLHPRRVVAIGNDTVASAQRVAANSREVLHVRHPSYGGHKEFLLGMTELYELGVLDSQLRLF